MWDAYLSVEAAVRRRPSGGMRKTSQDVDRYRAALTDSCPDIVVELGTFTGQSARFFAGYADVITVDVVDYVGDDRLASVTYLLGSSTDDRIIGQIHDLAAGRNVMLSLDSDHASDHVFREMEAYSPLVKEGGYMVVEDGITRYFPIRHSGPMDAIERFLSIHDDWRTDLKLHHRHPVGCFPLGWLYRNPPTEEIE